MENYKVYVEVTVKFSTDGVMMPVEFIWEDGTKYIIDKVKSMGVQLYIFRNTPRFRREPYVSKYLSVKIG